jgi:hypothetical protein
MRLLGLVAGIVAVWLLLKSIGKTVTNGAAGVPSPAPLASYAQSQDALDNFTQAIFQYEGGKPGNRNVVNDNPGNVRSGPGMTGSAGGYATFADVGDGWDALAAWVKKHITANPDWDFYDTFSYYLRGNTSGRTDAQGNSDAYADYVADYMGVPPTSTVSSVLGYGS